MMLSPINYELIKDDKLVEQQIKTDDNWLE